MTAAALQHLLLSSLAHPGPVDSLLLWMCSATMATLHVGPLWSCPVGFLAFMAELSNPTQAVGK